MPIARFVVTLQHTDSLPEDKMVNVWHFDVDNLTTAVTDIASELDTFYSAIDGGFANTVASSGHTITVYNLSDAEPRAPILETALINLTVGSSGLPHELSVCLSFQAEKVSGQSQRNRRGRLYMPPYHTAANDGGRIRSTEQDALRDAAQALLTASVAAADWDWVVYSRVENAGYVVDNGWVDNAWDVQRRRGIQASTRMTFS